MTFSAQWLKLREPYDHAARNIDVLEAVTAHFEDRLRLRIVDLACGSGSTARAMSPHIAARQDWTLVDNDLGLLALAGAQEMAPASTMRTRAVDLARDLEAALDGAPDLVVTSAFLDLVSEPWLERLTVECAARRLPVYAALSYDGRVTLDPPDAADGAVIDAVNAHQQTDKGFGPALGPEAVGAALARFEALGYRIVSGPSDWLFGARDHVIQRQMVEDWAQAAAAINAPRLRSQAPPGLSKTDIPAWLARRKTLIDAGRATIRVGHVDFFAVPPGRR